MVQPVLECRSIQHRFGTGTNQEIVLNGVSLKLNPGQTTLLMGPSGSGKTTLLSILGCLLVPTSGEVVIENNRIVSHTKSQLALIRRQKIGFVFQQSRLLPFLSVWENLNEIGRNGGIRDIELNTRINELAQRLNLEPHLRKRPSELSGGQQQRVAIGRALLLRPPIILADEPTASLDWKHGEEVIRLLIEQVRNCGATLLTVTHDARLIPLFDRHISIDGGQLSEVSK